MKALEKEILLQVSAARKEWLPVFITNVLKTSWRPVRNNQWVRHSKTSHTHGVKGTKKGESKPYIHPCRQEH
jgi:hypothetical protein